METKTFIRQWNSKTIRQRADGWLSLTDMATACDKLFADWYRQQSTQDFVSYAESVMGIPITEIKQGGTDQGTWGHPKVAIKFAMWLSVPFEFQVTAWIEELLTQGSVDIQDAPISDFEAVKVAEVLKPRLITNQRVDFSEFLGEEEAWFEAMRLLRNRQSREYKDNPKLLRLILQTHDAKVEQRLLHGKPPEAPRETPVVAVMPDVPTRDRVKLTTATGRYKTTSKTASGKQFIFHRTTQGDLTRVLANFLEPLRGRVLTSREITEGCVDTALIEQYSLNTFVRCIGKLLPALDWAHTGTRRKVKDAHGKVTHLGLYTYIGSAACVRVPADANKNPLRKLPPLGKCLYPELTKQSTNGKQGKLFYRDRPVYSVPMLPPSDQTDAIGTTSGVRIPEALHKAVQAAVGRYPIGSVIDGADIAPAVYCPRILDTHERQFLNRKISFCLSKLGFLGSASYTNADGKTVALYVRVSEGQNNA